MRWPKTLKRVRGLSDLLLFLNLVSSVLCMMALLRLVPLLELLRRCEKGKHDAFSIRKVKSSVRYLDFIVFALLRLRNPCLVRSLILFRYLRRAGIEVSIVFGAAAIDERFCGHAWLEYRDRAIFERRRPADVHPAVFRYPNSGREDRTLEKEKECRRGVPTYRKPRQIS